MDKVSKSFSLLSEPWILLANGDEVGLLELFRDTEGHTQLGGTATEKVSMFKLLLAISQSACHLKLIDYRKLSNQQFSKMVIDYLVRNEDLFYLYHDQHPFLQFKEAVKAKKVSYKALCHHLNEPSTNSTVTGHHQIVNDSDVTDAMLARLLVEQMSFCFSGKKTDTAVSFSGDLPPKSGVPGPSLLFFGAMHYYMITHNIVDTLRLNLYTVENLDPQLCRASYTQLFKICPSGIGVAPWESMPAHESCSIANQLTNTYMGRLVPMARFCLINREEKSLHYMSGIQHPNYLDGKFDATVLCNSRLEKPKISWADTSKAPWRNLVKIFSFIAPSATSADAYQVQQGLFNMKMSSTSAAKLVCAGIQVGLSTGETVVNNKCGYVYQEVSLQPSVIGVNWYNQLNVIWGELEHNSKRLFACVNQYYDGIKLNGASRDNQVLRVQAKFWESIEKDVRQFVLSIDDTDEITPDAIDFIKNVESVISAKSRRAFGLLRPSLPKNLIQHRITEGMLSHKASNSLLAESSEGSE